MQISTTTAIDRKIPNTLLSLSSVLIFDLAVFTGYCIRLHRDNHALNRYFIDFRKDRPIEAVGTNFCLRQTRPFFVANEYLFVANKTFFIANQHCLRQTKHSSSQTNICLWQNKTFFVANEYLFVANKTFFIANQHSFATSKCLFGTDSISSGSEEDTLLCDILCSVTRTRCFVTKTPCSVGKALLSGTEKLS